MRRRKIHWLIGLVAAGLSVPTGLAAPAPAKEETVTLSITGMT